MSNETTIASLKAELAAAREELAGARQMRTLFDSLHAADVEIEAALVTAGVGAFPLSMNGIGASFAERIDILRKDRDYFKDSYSRKLHEERALLETADALIMERDEARGYWKANADEAGKAWERAIAAESALAAERVANAGLRASMEKIAACCDAREAAGHDPMQAESCDVEEHKIARAALSVAPPNAPGALRAASVEAVRCAEHDAPLANTSFFRCGCRYVWPPSRSVQPATPNRKAADGSADAPHESPETVRAVEAKPTSAPPNALRVGGVEEKRALDGLNIVREINRQWTEALQEAMAALRTSVIINGSGSAKLNALYQRAMFPPTYDPPASVPPAAAQQEEKGAAAHGLETEIDDPAQCMGAGREDCCLVFEQHIGTPKSWPCCIHHPTSGEPAAGAPEVIAAPEQLSEKEKGK